ncbi:Mob1/phocein [Lojkania enalia]|uniref:Mob1/phocein n=1 Tax=Lojkania enalia TaxID=147567 RepID=A0A9P4N894_9PLEO|nr:Mob1/phocein [Didymosphaeria enalia]
MAASALSPSSSPRLPSPPPIAEDQLGPKSPVATTEEQQKLFTDHGAGRRIRPGTKAADMAEGPPLIELSDIQSGFHLIEHLKALHNFLTHPIGSNSTIPVDKEMALKLAQPPDGQDRTMWLYELCRFLTQKVNSIIVALFFDNPPCSSVTCPEMRASEWQYLCAVHDPPKSCCAIDYCCHTLDWAANTLTSPKNFPSRAGVPDPATQHQQIRAMTNIFRRVYRIFAHAWFQHREVFWKVEGRTGLYSFFKTVCDEYGLIPEDNYTIPPEAEGFEPATEAAPVAPPLIMKREPSGPGLQEIETSSVVEGVTDHTLPTAGTTKRHRHSPSVGATTVSTVVEETEEDDEQPKKPEPVPEEPAIETTPETEDLASLQELTIGETSEAAEQSASPEAETSHAVDEVDKQDASEAEKEGPAAEAESEPKKEEQEGKPSEVEASAVETKLVEEKKNEAEVKAEAEMTFSEEAEKAGKGEAVTDVETASDAKEAGEKPGSAE